MSYKKSIQLFLNGLSLVALTLSCAVPQVPVPVAKKSKKAQEIERAEIQGDTSVREYCREIEQSFQRYGWGRSGCRGRTWLAYRQTSVQGRPLAFQIFGDWAQKQRHPREVNTTLILCAVHGDEVTPVKFCYDILNFLQNRQRHQLSLEHSLVVVAPLVNPDAYLKKRPTRTNANGVDVNRNFPTADFDTRALSMWRRRYRSDPRRYPGLRPMSEPETAFQVDLIETFAPDKIISVHAPLSMLDYDGPEGHYDGGRIGPSANQLLMNMGQKARSLRIKNYPFFPGSLGNWAGHERNIPTFTLELPSSDNRHHRRYWRLFKDSVVLAIEHGLDEDIDLALEDTREAPSPR